MIYIFFVCVVLWLLAVLMVNLTLTGKKREHLCGLLRVFLLFALMAIGTFIKMGTLPMDAADFSAVVLLCAAVACGHFFVSDFTLYVKEQTPAAAKRAMVTASATMLLLVFILFLALRIISFYS